jgi:hypothetical protein
MAKARLTRHQREVYDSLLRRSRYDKASGQWTWVRLEDIGSKAGLDHLVDKGYALRDFTVGPRGGRHFVYRPAALLPALSPEQVGVRYVTPDQERALTRALHQEEWEEEVTRGEHRE